MAIFVRPATWSYDIELFRAATADDDQLEALLAAIATPSQALWVVESDERPVAFAWTESEPGRDDYLQALLDVARHRVLIAHCDLVASLVHQFPRKLHRQPQLPQGHVLLRSSLRAQVRRGFCTHHAPRDAVPSRGA